MIPDGWQIREFYDVASIKGGLVDPKLPPFCDYLHVGPEDIDGTSGMIIGPLSTAAEIGLISGKFEFCEGDILYSKIRPNLNKVARAGHSGLCSADMYVVTAVDNESDTAFLYHLLRGEEFYKQAVAGSMRSGMPKVNRDDLGLVNLTIPPLPEQRRIAALLDGWDNAIASCERLIAAKERRVDWVRANVLTGKARLPGFERPWQSSPIAKVLTEHGQTSTGREEVHSVSVHHGLINQIEHLGRSFAAADTDHYNRVLPGDIVYTKSPTGDFPLGIIKQSKLDKAAIVSPLYGVFTPASRELGTIMDTLFASPAAAERLLAPVVQKGAKNTIAVTNKNFLKAQLNLPTDQREIVALSELVEAARAELDVHQTELKLLRNQKRGLMQKLLTGQWRVPESIDALLPEALAT